ncbi:MAG: sigma-70 family RNA polymerase sigma factor [Planctomycetota bacterium]|nr:sigma-70 family RNA polymerase sigma factor [Planctomycetota bacterium]
MDERRLAERAIGGDPEAMRELWRDCRGWVAAVLLAHMPRGAEVEDLLQDVAMTMVRKISTIRDPGLVKPWLRSVAANAARTAGRRRKAGLRLVSSVEDSPEVSLAEAADRLAAREEAERALEAARELPEEYREPLLMRCVQGMTYQQIAEAMELPVTTIETRLARARRMLREQLEGDEERAGRFAGRSA